MDSPILLGVIASFPTPFTSVEQGTVKKKKKGKEPIQELKKWVRLVMRWARRRWGKNTLIIYHRDESRPHLHILPHLDGKSINRTLFPYAFKRDGRPYLHLTGFQLDYHRQVGEPMGWSLRSQNPRKRVKERWLYEKLKKSDSLDTIRAARSAHRGPNDTDGDAEWFVYGTWLKEEVQKLKHGLWVRDARMALQTNAHPGPSVFRSRLDAEADACLDNAFFSESEVSGDQIESPAPKVDELANTLKTCLDATRDARLDGVLGGCLDESLNVANGTTSSPKEADHMCSPDTNTATRPERVRMKQS